MTHPEQMELVREPVEDVIGKVDAEQPKTPAEVRVVRRQLPQRIVGIEVAVGAEACGRNRNAPYLR